TPPGTVNSITNQLAKDSVILAIIAVVLAVFNGSRLFILIEGIFGIIYHVRHRTFIKQNLMAIGMLILFIILIPIMAFTSALPTLRTALSGIWPCCVVRFCHIPLNILLLLCHYPVDRSRGQRLLYRRGKGHSS